MQLYDIYAMWQYTRMITALSRANTEHETSRQMFKVWQLFSLKSVTFRHNSNCIHPQPIPSALPHLSLEPYFLFFRVQ